MYFIYTLADFTLTYFRRGAINSTTNFTGDLMNFSIIGIIGIVVVVIVRVLVESLGNGVACDARTAD